MRIYSYSPAVEAYAKANGSAIDLSQDIVACTVSRKTDAASEFSVTLQNKNWKYNGLFNCFDPIVIYGTKEGPTKLFTGYITNFDAFQLYQGDFHISGLCTLYRLQKYYWDPLLLESQSLMFANAYNNNQADNGYAMVTHNLLTEVAGWPSGSIFIEESIPSSALEMAREHYRLGFESSEQLKSMADEFYKILQEHGPQLSSTSTTGGGLLNGDPAGVCELYASWEGKFAYSQEDGRLDPVNSGYGDCSSTIWAAYNQAAGIDVGTWTGDMAGKGTEIASGSGEIPLDKMAPADLVLMCHYGYDPSFDHVELYMGDNKLMGHGGPGNGPTWKQDAVAYMNGEAYWCIKRHLEPKNSSSSKKS